MDWSWLTEMLDRDGERDAAHYYRKLTGEEMTPDNLKRYLAIHHAKLATKVLPGRELVWLMMRDYEERARHLGGLQ